MNDLQPYKFEPEGTLEEEDNFDCFEVESLKKHRGELGTLAGVCVNSMNQWIPRRNLFVAFPCKLLTLFQPIQM